MSGNRKCIFCGNTELSKEHIFAQWLLKELDIYDADVSMTHASVAGLPISNRKHPFSKLVNGLVCEKCNNGWMSQLEGDCKQHITNIMNVNEIESEVLFLKDNHNTVAKWAFKNVILLNSASNYRQLVPENHYAALYSGSIPNGVFIDFAFCKSKSTVEWRQHPCNLIVKDKTIPFNPKSVGYIITFQIKELLIKVAFYESSDNVYYEDEGSIRLFPQFGMYGTPKIFDNIDAFDVHGVIHEYRNIQE